MKTYFLEAEGGCPKIEGAKYIKGILSEDEIIKKCGDAEIISTFIYSPMTAKVISNLSNLKFIAVRATGYNNIDLPAAKAKNILVSNVPEYGSDTVAEHTFALLLALARKLIPAAASTKKGKFSEKNFQGFDLNNKILGVIGTGKIGINVIKIAKGFGMKVLANDAFPKIDMARLYQFRYVPLDDLLRTSDIISLHVPLLESTRHIISKEKLSLIKKGTVLINTARGELVETEALISGLKDGTFSAAGLDVLENEKSLTKEHPLLRLDNIILTPHIAWYTKEAENRIAETTLENINAFLAGSPKNLVK